MRYWTETEATEAAGPGEVVVRRMVEATNDMMADYPMFFVEPAGAVGDEVVPETGVEFIEIDKGLFEGGPVMTKSAARQAVLRIAQCTIQQSIWLDEPGRIEWADDGKLLKALYDFVDQVYQEEV